MFIKIFEINDKCALLTETPYMTIGWMINMKNVEINDPWSDDITTASVIWWNHPLAMAVMTDVTWYASLPNTFSLAGGKLNERRHNYPARQGSMSPDYCGNLSVSTVLVFSSLYCTGNTLWTELNSKRPVYGWFCIILKLIKQCNSCIIF